MINKQPKSREGAERQYSALINTYRRNFAGGGSFGFDWVTFRLNSPELYARARELAQLANSLPSRHSKEGAINV